MFARCTFALSSASLIASIALSACARRAPERAWTAGPLRGAEASIASASAGATLDGALEADASLAATERASLVEERRSPDAATPPLTGRACTRDSDCVLVTGGCAGPMAAHRDDAAEVDARNQRILSTSTCDGRFTARPVRAVCDRSRCALEPLDRVEWRACASTRDCLAIHRSCSQWQAIHRRFEREAREALRLSQPCGPIVIPPPPRIECRYNWCVTGWAGP
jgi:hypothetical protein